MKLNPERLQRELLVAKYLDALENDDFATRTRLWELAGNDLELLTRFEQLHVDLLEVKDRIKEFSIWFDKNSDQITTALRSRIKTITGYSASDAVASAGQETIKELNKGVKINNPSWFVKKLAFRKYSKSYQKHKLEDKIQRTIANNLKQEIVSQDQLIINDIFDYLSNHMRDYEVYILEGKLDGLSNEEIAARLSERGVMEGCGPDQVQMIWQQMRNLLQDTNGFGFLDDNVLDRDEDADEA